MTYFKVKVIGATFPNAYHVVNTTNNVTQSMWPSFDKAMAAMRDLNSLERRNAKALNALSVRSELSPLRLVTNN